MAGPVFVSLGFVNAQYAHLLLLVQLRLPYKLITGTRRAYQLPIRRIFCTCTHVEEDFAPVALAMANSDQEVPHLGAHNEPNQPLQFDFPKREFGKTRIVKRAFQSQWFGRWWWLHYDCSRDLVVILVSLLSRQGG